MFAIGNYSCKLSYAEREELSYYFGELDFETQTLANITEIEGVGRELCRVIGIIMDQIEKEIIEDKEWEYLTDLELKNRILDYKAERFKENRCVSDELIKALQTQLKAFKTFIDENRDKTMVVGSDYYFGRDDVEYEQFEFILGDTHYELKWKASYFDGYSLFESLCYYIINKHYKNPKFEHVDSIGSINTRKGVIHKIKVKDIPKNLYNYAFNKVWESHFIVVYE